MCDAARSVGAVKIASVFSFSLFSSLAVFAAANFFSGAAVASERERWAETFSYSTLRTACAALVKADYCAKLV